MLSFLLSLISPLSRILDSIDKSTDAGTEREKAKLEAVKSFATVQASMVNGPGKWLLALFVVPLGLHFWFVIIYGWFWCAKCMFPQPWEIAALPPSIAPWGAWIIASLFGFGAAVMGAGIFKR